MEHLPALQLPVLRILAEQLTIKDLITYSLISELHQVRIVPNLPYLVKYVKPDNELHRLFICLLSYDDFSSPFKLSFVDGILQNKNFTFLVGDYTIGGIISRGDVPLLELVLKYPEIGLPKDAIDYVRSGDMLEFLLTNGVEPTEYTLVYAISSKKKRMIDVLLADKRTPITSEVLKSVINTNDVSLLKVILEKREISPFYLAKAIHTAGLQNKAVMLKLLLNNLSTVDYKDVDLQEVLINGFMVYSVHLDKPNEKLWDMTLPYIVDKKVLFRTAVEQSNSDVLEYLIKKGISEKVSPSLMRRHLPRSGNKRYNGVKAYKILKDNDLLK